MIIIDALEGISIGLTGSEVENIGGPENLIMEINDSQIYGNSVLDDCPPDAGYCYSHLTQ